ncbi:hypothetical protein NC652_022000 [Populus alba x Populus x berolinensis]|nr:hypothetical protein NC652_022000 [Populus alba x Populus x berolinensis]
MKVLQPGRALEESRKLRSWLKYREIETLTSEISDDAIDRKSGKILSDLENDHLPFLCLQYKDSEGVEHSLPAVYLGIAGSTDGSKLKNMVSANDSSAQTAASSLPNVTVAVGVDLPREVMQVLLDREEKRWEKLFDSELGGLWCVEGSLETLSWMKCYICQKLTMNAVESYKEQRN